MAKKFENGWDVFEHVSWNLYEPLSKAKFNTEIDLMNMEVPIKTGDKIAIIYYNFCHHCSKKNQWKTTVVLTENFKGKPTVKNVLQTLEKGLNKVIKPGDRRRGYEYYFDKERKFEKNYIIYSKISNYFDSKERINLIQKYEEGKLKPYELLGDHRYFEGMRKKGNIIEFYTGS